MDKKEKDGRKQVVIFIVILFLIGLTVAYIVYCCVYMWSHNLTQIEADFFSNTMNFLAQTLIAEIGLGFLYKGSKNYIESKNTNEPPLT